MQRIKIAMQRAALASLAASLLVGAPARATSSEAPQPFTAAHEAGSFDRALQCLTQAIYYEARGESDAGQRAVAQVVLNRVRHPSYPNSVCGVVYQGSQRQTGCQFTFTCDGSIRGYVDPDSWGRAQRVASAALSGSVYRPVGLALNYHTTAIRPYWAPSLVRQAVIGSHIFYTRPDSGGVNSFSQTPSMEPAVGYAAAFAAPRARRAPVTGPLRNYQAARVELAVVERPRVERPTFQRIVYESPPGFGAVRTRRNMARSSLAPAAVQLRPAAMRTGPRTTIESGVHVSRGS